MNRRSFLRRLAAAAVGVAVAPHLAFAERPITLFEAGSIVPGPVGEFEVMYYFQGELLCDNPSASFVITDIAE